jgi:cellulose synthase/poly-beta-1,6-N-acetylglucosamine synthase-like glycosyltransferase
LYKEHYLDPYALSGVFDEQTRGAVQNFQTHYGLVIPTTNSVSWGVVDAATRALIHTQSLHDLVPRVAQVTSDTTRLGQLKERMKSMLRALYIAFLPTFVGFFVGVVFLTLLLVIARMVLLVGLLIWRERYGAMYGYNGPPDALPPQGVSVLIPAYNEEQNIAATVESVLRTTHPLWEVIVIDDGSHDDTSGAVRSVIANHPWAPVRLLEVKNGGKASALNQGTEVALYDIIAVLDADAVLDQEALTHFSKHFYDPRVGAVAGKVSTTGNTKWLDIFQSLEYAVGQNIDKKAFATVGAVGVVPGPAGAWRKEILRAVGGFHTDTLVEDQEMTLSVLRVGAHIIYEPRSIAYTETPHTLENFLKQRFRWVYGTIQCFWKYKFSFLDDPSSVLSSIVLPNILIYNILLPMTYPFADSALIFGLVFGQSYTLVVPFVIFTSLDLLYAYWGVREEPHTLRLMIAVPLQRLIYKWLLYYTVARAIVRAIEGSGSRWNKFKKVGETSRFFFSNLQNIPAVPIPSTISVSTPWPIPQPHNSETYQVMPEEVTTVFQGPSGTAVSSTNFQEVVALSLKPRHFQSAGDTSSPALSPNVLVGYGAEPNT